MNPAEPTSTQAAAGAGAERSWRPVIVLAALVLFQVVAYATLFHRSEGELESMWDEGTPEERAWALHVLSNRGEVDEDRFDASFIRGLLEEEDLLVREMAFTSDMTRLWFPVTQTQYLGELQHVEEPDMDHLMRSFFLFKRRIGVLKLQRLELDWLLMLEDGKEPTPDELRTHLDRRNFERNVRQGLVDPETGEWITPPPSDQ